VAGQRLNVAGGVIELTPERWAKMVQLVEEFGRSAARAVGGGRWTWQRAHNPIG
jgi:hypothetical protein